MPAAAQGIADLAALPPTTLTTPPSAGITRSLEKLPRSARIPATGEKPRRRQLSPAIPTVTCFTFRTHTISHCYRFRSKYYSPTPAERRRSPDPLTLTAVNLTPPYLPTGNAPLHSTSDSDDRSLGYSSLLMSRSQSSAQISSDALV